MPHADRLTPAARLVRTAGVLGGAGLVTVVAGLALTGGAAASLLADPGAVTRWGLPTARLARDLAASLTIGMLVLAATALPASPASAAAPTSPTSPRRRCPTPRIGAVTLTAVRLAGATGAVWVLAGLVLLVLSYARLSGLSPADPAFAAQLGRFVTELDLLRALVLSTAVAAAVTIAATLALRHSTVGWLAVLAIAALLPVAATGHSASATNHELGVDSLAFHLIGVTVWMGGLAALSILRGRLGSHLVPAADRYSTLALWAFAAVAVSGLVNAAVRLGGWAGLGTTYGALVVVKAIALVLLGAAGVAHRRRAIEALTAQDAGLPGPRGLGTFWRLVVGELIVMAVATGAAVALASSAPPEPAAAGAPVSVTGYPVPAALESTSWLTTWRLDLFWATVAATLLGLYVVAAIRLARRGDAWPALRTASWVLGCLLLVWVTSGAAGVYGRVLFSAHMLGHMTLSMVIAPLLVLGAPVTLAMRTLSARRDGSRGPREWLLAVVHSRLLALLGHPLIASGLFAGSLVAFYYSPLFGLSLRTHTGHLLMTLHFLLVGYLFASVLIGVDPAPRRPPYPLRLVLLFATMAFHAFFGVALLSGSSLLAPEVFGAIDRPWGRSPIADQQYGGAVAWGVGEFPVVLLGLGIAMAWVRSDERESRRQDRQADRDGDVELEEYNARLTRLADRGQD